MQKRETTLPAFHFRRATADVIQVFNEGSYLMAEYSERTGVVSWHRVVAGSQRDVVEKALRNRYPVAAPPPGRKPVHAGQSRPRHQKRAAR